MPGGKVIINASHKHRHLTPQSTRLSRRKWVILPVYHHPLTRWFQRNVGFMRWCSSVCIVDPEMPLNDSLSTWDENSITWMHKYHVLKEEAQDTVVNSKHVQLDTYPILSLCSSSNMGYGYPYWPSWYFIISLCSSQAPSGNVSSPTALPRQLWSTYNHKHNLTLHIILTHGPSRCQYLQTWVILKSPVASWNCRHQEIKDYIR